jgi:quinol monooxygenase YgiN
MEREKVGLSVVLKAKQGKEEDLRSFLESAQNLVAQESGTVAWFAFRIDTQTFGIFDTFDNSAARQAHLNGPIASALLGRADELLAGHPEIHAATIIGQKLPR